MAGPGLLRLLTQCSPGISPRGWAVCLQGTLGRRLGSWPCPQALPEAPGEEGCVRSCPLKSWACPGPADTLHTEAFSAKRLPLQELSAEALDLACPSTWSDVSSKAGFWTVPAPPRPSARALVCGLSLAPLPLLIPKSCVPEVSICLNNTCFQAQEFWQTCPGSFSE